MEYFLFILMNIIICASEESKDTNSLKIGEQLNVGVLECEKTPRLELKPTQTLSITRSLTTPKRPKNQKDVIELTCEPIKNIRVAIIGLGKRGWAEVLRHTYLEDTTVVALCDIEPKKITSAQKILKEKGYPLARVYTGATGWKKLCESEDIDLVYICTHWDLHTPAAVYAMEHGKHVAIEVPAALTIQECWQLVNTAEKTQRHCIQLENVNYDYFQTSALNMVQHDYSSWLVLFQFLNAVNLKTPCFFVYHV